MIDTSKWIEELDEVDKMSLEELRAELQKMATAETFLGIVASLALVVEQERR